MADGTKSNIGTVSYFRDISSQTVFDGISIEKSKSGFSDRLREISEKAAEALEMLYDDIEQNKIMIQFMDEERIKGLEKLAAQLYDAAKIVSVSIRKSLSDIEKCLKSLALPSRYSMQEVEIIAKEIKKGTQFNVPPYQKIDEKLLQHAH